MPAVVTFAGRSVKTHILLDGGANACAISSSLAQKLQLPFVIESRDVSTFEYRGVAPRKLTSFQLESLDGSFNLDITEALIGDILTTENDHPPTQADIEEHSMFEGTVYFEEIDNYYLEYPKRFPVNMSIGKLYKPTKITNEFSYQKQWYSMARACKGGC